MKDMDKTEQLLKEMANYRPEFREGFSGRVMENIDNVDEEESQIPDFNRFLGWISLSGVAAIIGLLFMVYFAEGTIDIDAIYGLIDYSPDEPLLTSMNF